MADDDEPVARITVHPQEPVVDWRRMGALADLSGVVRGPYEGWAPSPLQVAPEKTFGDYLGDPSRSPQEPRERDSLLRPPQGESPMGVPLSAARFLLPGLTDPRNAQPSPPPSMQATLEGKLPPATGNTGMSALADTANIGAMFAGGPEAALASKGAGIIAGIGAARRIPRIGARIGDIAEMPGVTTGRPQPQGYRAGNQNLAPGVEPTPREEFAARGYGGNQFSDATGEGFVTRLINDLGAEKGLAAVREVPKPQPVRRTVGYRDPTGRPTQTAPLPRTTQEILEAGYKRATEPLPPGVTQPPLMQAAERKGPRMGDIANLSK